jgi:predicted secreted protein
MLRKSLWSASATLALLAALASPLAAVGGTPGQLPVGPAIIHVSCDAFTNTPQVESSVDVAVGDTVSLSLCSDPSTGYEWTQPESSDPAVASVGEWVSTPPAEEMPGAAGLVETTVMANAAGTAVVSSSYDRSWEGGEKGTWTMTLTVNVSDAVALRIDCDAFGATPDAVASVDASVGDTLVVTLCSNPSTGFRWSDPVSSDPGVASVTGWSFAPPQAETGMVGAPGAEVLAIAANAAGSAVVSASYDQPWDGGEKGAWTLELTVTVQ